MDINDPHSIVADPLDDGIDLLSDGDAVGIGPACRGLPENLRGTNLKATKLRGTGFLPSPLRGAMQEPPRG